MDRQSKFFVRSKRVGSTHPTLANSNPNLLKRRQNERRFLFWGRYVRVFRMSIRMRHTRGHTRNRRSHHALLEMRLVKDKESGNLRLPHRVDEITGTYRGRVLRAPKPEKKVKTEKVKKEKKSKAAHDRAHEHKHDHLPTGKAGAHEVSAGEKPNRSFFSRLTQARPKARSGTGS